MVKWNVETLCRYRPITTFWDDFSIADAFGVAAIIDANRIIVVGNGNSKMVTDPNGQDAKQNRRTDIFFKTIES